MFGCAAEHQKTENVSELSYRFVTAADPQIFWGARENWQQTIREINRLNPRPDFVVVCGDLTENPGNHQEITAYKEELKKLDPQIRLYQVVGNHDVGSVPTPELLAAYEQQFEPRCYSFEHVNSLFVVMDSTIIKGPTNKTESLAQEQMKWLKDVFARAGGQSYTHKFVFMHHPVILESMDEEEEYFNLPTLARQQLTSLFIDNQVDIVFSGHYHRDRVIQTPDIEFVVNGSCGKALGESDLGFRIVDVDGTEIEHVFYKLPDQQLRY